LDIGIFDAQSLNASASGGIYQHDPGTFLGANFTVTAAANPGSSVDQVLQGSLGTLDFNDTNNNGAFFDTTTATNTFLTGGHDGGDIILTTGGTTTVTLHNPQGADFVGLNMFNDNSDLNFGFETIGGVSVPTLEDQVAVTDDFGAFNKAGAHATTISNFVVVGSNPGVNDDILSISPNSWGFGGGNGLGGTYFGLLNVDGNGVPTEAFANMGLASGGTNTLPATTDVIVYELNNFSGGLAALEHALTATTGGAITLNFAPGDENSFDMLFAFNNGAGGVNIADIQFEAEGGGTSTFGFDIQSGSHNLAVLTNITGGVGSLFTEYLTHHSNILFNS